MHNKKQTLFITFSLLFLLSSLQSYAKQNESNIKSNIEPRTIHVTRTETAPTIDGNINEAVWQNITPSSGFFQFDPSNGSNASEDTEVRVLYDGKYIYFAFFMKDSQPNKIWAELTPR